MKNDKITPQLLYEAGRIIWPDLKRVEKTDSTRGIQFVGTDKIAQVDWPNGFDHWPVDDHSLLRSKALHEFDKFAACYDTDGDTWQDMPLDEVFVAGFLAGSKQVKQEKPSEFRSEGSWCVP